MSEIIDTHEAWTPFELMTPDEGWLMGSTSPSEAVDRNRPVALSRGKSLEDVKEQRKLLLADFHSTASISAALGYDRPLVVEFSDINSEGEVVREIKYKGFWDDENEEVVSPPNPDTFDQEVKEKYKRTMKDLEKIDEI